MDFYYLIVQKVRYSLLIFYCIIFFYLNKYNIQTKNLENKFNEYKQFE